MTGIAPPSSAAVPFDELVEHASGLATGDFQLISDLVAIRERHGLSVAQVADRLGVPTATVTALERHGDPRLSLLRRYALAVGAHVEHTVRAR